MADETKADVADQIAEMLRGHGLKAHVERTPERLPLTVTAMVLGAIDDREEDVLFMHHAGEARVYCCAVPATYAKTLRARNVWDTEVEALRRRCAQIAERYMTAKTAREVRAKAWPVVDDLKRLGLSCGVASGGIEIVITLSPEEAAQKGPAIAAVLSGEGAP